MSSSGTNLDQCPQCDTLLQEQNQGQALFCSVCRFPLMLVAGKYRLERKLAEGGAGVLYLARHIGLSLFNERVIKVLKSSLFEKEGAKERFHREVQVTANLSEYNSHIVRIYDDFGDEPQLGPYYVMEYLRGESLKQRLETGERLPLVQVFHIFKQLCSAMGAAHQAGIIHRDLKPENIFLIRRDQDDSFVKIFDFGLARPTDTKVNITQGIFGTPAYMSPEQCQGNSVDARTDIYSMGIILYEMLAGELPYVVPRHESMTLLVAHIAQQPIPLLNHRPDLPAGLNDGVLGALVKDPDHRYATAAEFWDRIAMYAQDPVNVSMASSGGVRVVNQPGLFMIPMEAHTQPSLSSMAPATLGYAGDIVLNIPSSDGDDEPTFVNTNAITVSPNGQPVIVKPVNPWSNVSSVASKHGVDLTKTVAQETVPEELLRQAYLLDSVTPQKTTSHPRREPTFLPESAATAIMPRQGASSPPHVDPNSATTAMMPRQEPAVAVGESTEIATPAILDPDIPKTIGVAEYNLDDLLMDEPAEQAASRVGMEKVGPLGMDTHVHHAVNEEQVEEAEGQEMLTVRAVNPLLAVAGTKPRHLLADTDPSGVEKIGEKPMSRSTSLVTLLVDEEDQKTEPLLTKESTRQEEIPTLREGSRQGLAYSPAFVKEDRRMDTFPNHPQNMPISTGEIRMAELNQIRTVPLAYRPAKSNLLWWLLAFLLLAVGMVAVAVYLIVKH